MQLDAFFPYITAEVLGCPDPTLRLALLQTAAEFCRETLAWTEIQDPVSLINGIQDYELDAPANSYVLSVRDIWIGNRRLQPRTMQEIAMSVPNWQTTESNEPLFYNQANERGVIRVYPVPQGTTGQAIVIRAAYVPSISATTLPDFLGNRHIDVIAAGTKARLMMVPGVTWTNPKLGEYHRSIFDDGVIKARISEAHDRVPGTIRVLPRSFGF